MKCIRHPKFRPVTISRGTASIGISAAITFAVFLMLALRPSIGMAKCLSDTVRDDPALSAEENKARQVFVSDVCRRWFENLYDLTDPRLRHRLTKPSLPPINVADIYPVTSKREHHEGRVRLAFIVDADGNVSNVSIISSSGYQDLDDAASIFFGGTHFAAPAKLDDVSVPVIMSLPIRFKIARGN